MPLCTKNSLVNDLVKDNGKVVASDKVPLSAARREVGEFLVEPSQVVHFQSGEKELEEVLLLEARREVLHLGIVHVKLKAQEKYEKILRLDFGGTVQWHLSTMVRWIFSILTFLCHLTLVCLSIFFIFFT